MATEMVNVKLDGKFLAEIDTLVESKGYHNRTEFIREALREKIEEVKMKEAMMSLAHLKGASKKKTTDKELALIREAVFDEFEKKLR